MQHNIGFIDFEEHESAGGPIGAGQEALAQLTSHDYTGRIGLLKAMRGVVIGIGGRRSDQREGKARGVRFSSVHFLVLWHHQGSSSRRDGAVRGFVLHFSSSGRRNSVTV